MKLVIVESPTKCETIGRYLGSDYVVKASLGHIRDLATTGKGGLGVDVNNNFAPTYVINKDKRKVVYELKEAARKCDEVILATDPDREGEAIAWHLAVVLDLDVKKTKRLEFHEITRESIKEAMAHPRTIDMNLVSSQETRRILDRIIGFKLSALVNRKLRSKSAGRVQSATLKLAYDHELEIEKFVPEEYWEILSEVKLGRKNVNLNFVQGYNGKKKITSEQEALDILNTIGEKASIKSIKRSVRSTESKPPFTTSSLQQEAFSKIKFSTAKTSSVSQSLYEGINVNGEHVGLITYIRTDSVHLAPAYVQRAINYITETLGKEYVGQIKTKQDNALAQEAHEAIRPTSNHRTPESVRQFLTPDQYNLYKLIYNRAISSLMKPKKEEILTIELESNGNIFKLEYARTIFKGYEAIYKYSEEKDDVFPDVNEGEEFVFTKKEIKQNFTTPPARYSEAKIVKIMEEVGIGRPSTYASTIATLKKRKYVLEEKGLLTITEQGKTTAHVLDKYFPDIINAKYTAEMEEKLDKIQEGQVSNLEILNDFYAPFIKMIEDGYALMYVSGQEKTGRVCPVCGHDLVKKSGKNGDFIACSNYPTCKYVEKIEKPVEYAEGTCPNCGGQLVFRMKNNKKFVACSNYPKCNYIQKEEPKKAEPVKKCPKCETGYLVRKRGKYGYFLGCNNYPECQYMEKNHKKVRN